MIIFVKPVTRWKFNYNTFVNKTHDKIILFVLYASHPDHVLWKESLKRYGQQFHQYQQNKQPPLISTHWTW